MKAALGMPVPGHGSLREPVHDRAVGHACIVGDSCSARLTAFWRGVEKLAHFQFDAKSWDTINLLLDLRNAASALGYFAEERLFQGLCAAALLVKADAPTTQQLEAFSDLVPLAASLGDPRLVQRLKQACSVLEEVVRSAKRWRELDAESGVIEAGLEHFDMLTEREQQAVTEAQERVLRSARQESRRVTSVYHRFIGGPIRVARLPPLRARARRSTPRRVRRRTVCRRRQKDSGGSEEGDPGDPPGAARGALVEPYGVAFLRHEQERDQTSTAPLGERAQIGGPTHGSCGKGPYPEPPRVVLRLRSAASEAPLRGAGPRTGRRGAPWA